MIFNLIFSILLIVALFFVFQISRADFRRRIIPDVYLFPLLLIGLIISAFFPWVIGIEQSVIASAFGYAMGTIIGYLFEKYKKDNEYPPIGMGDIKLLAVGGLWLGMTGLPIAIMVSCIAGWLWGKKNKQKFIPFAPFFFIGAFIALIAMYFLI